MRVCAHRQWLRVGIVLVVLCAYVVATLGVIPSPTVIGRWLGRTMGTSERFACEDCGCGCASAMECWTHCCCHTPEERLAWALERGVMPPEGVQLSDETWVRAAKMLRPDQEHCGTCVAGMKDKARRGIGIRPVRTACDEHAGHAIERACSSGCGHACEDRPNEKCGSATACTSNPTTALLGPIMSALACKGIKELLVVGMPPTRIGGGAVTLPPPALCEELAVPSGETIASRVLEADDPPPRSAAPAS